MKQESELKSFQRILNKAIELADKYLENDLRKKIPLYYEGLVWGIYKVLYEQEKQAFPEGVENGQG